MGDTEMMGDTLNPTKVQPMNKLRVCIVAFLVLVSTRTFAGCPKADLTGDCRVNLADLGVLAEHWLTQGTCPLVADLTGDCFVEFDDLDPMALQWLAVGTPVEMDWIDIDDPGVPGQEGFIGKMSRTETTNAQYCQFLNSALASGDIQVHGNSVVGAEGHNPGADFAEREYYFLGGAGWTHNGAVNGGAARIRYNDGAFSVVGGFEHHPVTYVTWHGAMAFCHYYGWRLPTEWEWQAAADYDGGYDFGCGTTITNTLANIFGSTHPHGTTPVGAFGSYGYGLADMAGNVWEWTDSCYLPDCYLDIPVARGGSWSYDGSYSMVSYRYFDYIQNGTYEDFGFRVCKD